MPQACHLLNVFEIQQKHQRDQCEEHNYTVWSERSECELYLSTKEITETLYIKLTACPAGFVLSRQRGICFCDPLLDPYVTSCNLNDETVLRSANSWLFAYMVNESYEYKVSQHCPYDYCLPHQSHLNLSMPDTQCQFHRTGLACGECPQGPSTTFGSCQRKHCSDYYLFIIIPIAIIGIVLVIMIFIFNLTVTSGTINTFIFYVNIISINYSLALYSDDDSDDNIIIIHVLILLVLIYFFIVLSYQCLMSFSACSRIIIRLRNQITIPLEAFKDKIFTSSSTFDGVILKDVNNRVSGDYPEFQESLIALEN